MPVRWITILGLSSDVMLAVFSLALAILLLWQDARRRSTQYFALTMVIFALHGAVHTAWQVPQRFDLDPELVLCLSTSLYILGIIMLFNFICAFGELDSRIQVPLMAITSGTGAIYLVLIWSGRVFTNFEPVGADGYRYEYTSVGAVGVGAVFTLFLFTIAIMRTLRNQKAWQLAVPLALMLAGVIAHMVSRDVRVYPINSVALTLAVIYLGYLVLRYRVYLPLAVLNAELASTITELDLAMHRKAQFLANMSHELRTPLNSIIGYASLVVNRTYGELTPLQDDRLHKVIRNGHLLLELIDDVLDLTRIEVGRLSLRMERVPSVPLLNSVLDQYEEMAHEKGLTLLRSYGQLPALLVDEKRVQQILINLVSNAVKFTERGTVIVRGYYDIDHQQVVISVTDTGPGIATETRDHLFNIYSQPEPPNRQHEGTGLGLALASQLTAMHGGKLWFETETGRGTTFYVALPAFDDSLEIRLPVLPRIRSSGPIILAIDDDRQAIEVLQDQLEPSGYRVYGASTANDALRLARELKPALILLDLVMPDLDGWQIFDTLRGDPATSAIPVVIVSAHDYNQDEHRKADGYLCKPVVTEVLLDEVHKFTGDSSSNGRSYRLTPPILRRQGEDVS